MQKKYALSMLSGAMLALAATSVWPADLMQSKDQARDQAQQKIRDQDIYGHQLMTSQERDAHRAKMRAAKTAEERERIRVEHHEQMKIRAKERGVTLPDAPPANRGPGSGTGGAMGSGGRK